MAPIFRALGDPSRRVLLDQLFVRDGQTLGEMCSFLPQMTRFGVMRHLDVLEEARLITTMRTGREKRHYLNPVPIRLLHDRWISKYAEPVIGALSNLKRQLEVSPMLPDHVYSIFVKASPERVWKALVDGDDTVGYYFGSRVNSAWTPGAPIEYTTPDGSVASGGEVIAVDPPRRLEMTFESRWGAGAGKDGPMTQVWEIEPAEGGIPGLTRLSVTISGLHEGSEIEERYLTFGVPFILSGLKSLLETGQPMGA